MGFNTWYICLLLQFQGKGTIRIYPHLCLLFLYCRNWFWCSDHLLTRKKNTRNKRKIMSILNFFSRIYHSIKPEESVSFITGTKSTKAALLNPLHVSGHQPPKRYTNSPMTNDQEDMVNAPIAPGTPESSLITKNQDNNTWSTNEEADSHATILFLSWAWKNICMVKLNT